jgi:hypothetical protein
MALLYYCETRWLHRARMLHRVSELTEGTAIILSDSNKNNDVYLFCATDFTQKLACLVEIFENLIRIEQCTALKLIL